MQSEAKVSCYQELYTKLKEADTLSNFGWPSEKEHLDFYFNAGNTKINFRIFSNKDLMQLRSETIRTEQSEKENIEKARNISHDFYGVFGTAYDNKIILSLSVPFPSISDDAAKQLIIDKTNYFINMILSQLEEDFVNRLKKEKEEAERLAAEEEKNKKKKLNFFPIRKNIPASIKEKEENHEYENTPELDKSDTIITETQIEEYKNSPDISDVIPSENLPEIKNGIEEEVTDEKIDVLSEKDTSSHFEESVIEESSQDSTVVNTQEAEEKREEEICEPFEENESLEAEKNSIKEYRDTEKKEEQRSDKEIPYSQEEEVMSSVQPCLDNQYQNEPEISAKEMQKVSELYDSMNRTFSIRKEQLDYREKMLADQKQFLDCERNQLQIQKAEIEKKIEDAKVTEEKLQNNWEQYHKIKKKQENKGINLDEREKKISDLESEIQKREKEIKIELQEIENQKVIFKEQKLELEKSWKEYNEKINNLENYEERLTNVKQELSDHELQIDLQNKQIEVERKAIEDKLADLKETEEMVAQMQKNNNLFDLSKSTEKIADLLKEREELLKEKKQIISENAELKEMYDSLQDDLISKASIINQMEQMERDLKGQLQLMREKLNTSKEENNEVNPEKIIHLEEQIAELQAQKQETVSHYENRILQMKEEFDSLRTECSSLKEKAQEEPSMNLIEILSQGGYIVSNETRDNRVILTFSLGGCKVYIDEETRTVEIEKEVRKNYTKQLLELNEKYHNTGFFMGKGKVYCRFAYHDIVKELRDIISIMVKYR